MAKRYLPLLLISALGLALPAAWNVYASVWAYDWKASPLWDGQAYLVSSLAPTPTLEDPTGAAAAIATLASWQGAPVMAADVQAVAAALGFDHRLADVTALAAAFGLDGQWLRAEAGALPQLKTPFLAHVNDGAGRLVIVRDARSGYVYAADPERGNVVYPLERFVAAWTGQVFAFPEAPAQPEEWR